MKRRRSFRYLVTTGLFFILFGHLTMGMADAKTFRLVIGAGNPTAAVWVGTVKDFFSVEVKKRVEATTEHKIEWVEAYGGSVAKLGGVLDAIQDGILNVGYLNYPFEPTKLFLHNWSFVLPFDNPDVIQLAKVAKRVHEMVPYLTQVFEKDYNQVFLGCGVSNSYQLITTFPCATVADLKGKKIAAAGPNLPWLKGTGAVPVQSNLNEAYTSLQTGVYEGYIMFADAIMAFKLHEVAKYLALIDLGGNVIGAVTINKDTYNSLPKEIQNIMREVGGQWTMEMAKASKAKEVKAYDIFDKSGVKITRFSEDQRMAWANRLEDIPNQRAQEANKKGMPGSEVYRVYFREMEKEGFKYIRKWKID